MKNIYYSILLVLVTAAAFAQDSGDIPVPLTDPSKRGKLRVHINYGSITVKGTARKDVLVHYYTDENKNNDNKVDKNGLRRIGGGTLDLEVTENSNFVSVKSDSWNQKCNLTIEVPSGMDLKLHTYNDGDLNVYNIQGEIELINYNGEITAENISGSVVATTYNGEIKCTFDKISEGAPMSFITYNGDIDLTFPASLKANLKMKTEQGDIKTGFDVKLTAAAPVQKSDTRGGTYKVVVDEWVRAEVGGGGSEYIMRNYNGDILIRKK